MASSVSPSSRSSSGGPGGREPLAQALLGDPAGEARHLLDRRERAPGEQPADGARDEERPHERDDVPDGEGG